MRRKDLLYPILGGLLAVSLALGWGLRSAAAQEPTPAPPDDEITLPTATITPVGGPTATPTRTPIPDPVLAEILTGPVNIRTGPGLEFEDVGEATSGMTLPIQGRLLEIEWLLVLWEDGEAWIYEPLVTVRGDITTVPIVEAPPLNPVDAAVLETAAVLQQTPGAVETATAASLFEATQPVGGSGGGGSGAAADASSSGPPTFTPPPPIQQLEELPAPRGAANGDAGLVPPAALVIGMGVFGAIMVIVGVIRRFI